MSEVELEERIPRAFVLRGTDFVPSVICFMVTVLLDQASKAWVVAQIPFHGNIDLVPGLFSITHTYNRGVAFGMLAGVADPWRGLIIGVTTVLALTMIGYFFLFQFRHDPIARVALALVSGGAVGNIIDRVSLGHVIDFLDFFYQDWHWPAFNVADSAVCIGVAILLFRPGPQER